MQRKTVEENLDLYYVSTAVFLCVHIPIVFSVQHNLRFFCEACSIVYRSFDRVCIAKLLSQARNTLVLPVANPSNSMKRRCNKDDGRVGAGCMLYSVCERYTHCFILIHQLVHLFIGHCFILIHLLVHLLVGQLLCHGFFFPALDTSSKLRVTRTVRLDFFIHTV